MTEPKTRQTDARVKDFLDRIPDAERRRDCLTVLEIMKRATKAEFERPTDANPKTLRELVRESVSLVKETHPEGSGEVRSGLDL